MIQLTEPTEKRLKQLPKMGAMEAKAFKDKVIMSELSVDTKAYVILKIDERLNSLDTRSALAESGEITMGDLR